MSFIDNFFVFPQAVAIEGELKCNITADCYTLSFMESSHTIDLARLEPDSTTLVLYDEGSRSLFQVDHWEKILAHERLSSQQALYKLNRPNFIQVDHCRGGTFTKIFLPMNQIILASDTNDFSLYSHFPIDYLHPVDWHYHPTMTILDAVVEGNTLTLEIDAVPAIFDRDMFLSYGNESVRVPAGRNTLAFYYVKGKTLHLGSKPYYKGRGNSYRIEDYL